MERRTLEVYGGDEPVGYIQIYNAYDFLRQDKDFLAELSDSLAALDILIDEKKYLGKGLGTHVINQYLPEYRNPHYDACFIDSDPANIKTVRAYEKSGFKKIKTVKEITITWMRRGKDMNTNQLTFITTNTHEWDKKIIEKLRKECSLMTGIFKDFKPHSLYVTDDAKFAGGIVLQQHGNILWIDALWVELKFRKQGIGMELMRQAALWANQNNATEIQLNTYFKEAHDFFLSCSFEDVVIIPNWKYGLDCYLMRRSL